MKDKSQITLSLRDLLRVFFKRKKIIYIFFFSVVSLVTAATFLIPPKYLSTAQVLVNVGRENLYMQSREQLRQVVPGNMTHQVNSEMQLILSRSLAEKVINKLGPVTLFKKLEKISSEEAVRAGDSKYSSKLTEKAIELYNKALVVSPVKDSGVIKVGFKHRDPVISADVTNTLVGFYIEHHLKVHVPTQSYLFFENQSRVFKQQLDESEKALTAFKKGHNINSLSEERTLFLSQYSELEASSKKTNSDIIESKNRIAMIKKHLAATPKNVSKGQAMDPNLQLINVLQEKLVNLEIKEQELLAKYNRSSRPIVSIREEIDLVKNKLATYENKSYGRSSSGPNPTYLKLNQEILGVQTRLKALQGRKKIQRDQLGEYRVRLEKLNQLEAEYYKLQSAVMLNRENHRTYLNKIEESRISKAMDVEKIANVSIIELAVPPFKPESPKVWLNIALGIIFGISGGIVTAFIIEYFDDTIDSVEDVEELLQLPVLSSITYNASLI